MIKRLAVFCGAKPGQDPDFMKMAQSFGEQMAKQGIDLVYGGGKFGLMGCVANAVADNGGKVYGVITHQLDERGTALNSLHHLEIVDDMDTRKRRMMDLADGIVTFPGGLGTLEEVSEAASWITLGINEKPVVVYNYKGFYDHLADLLQLMDHQGFLEERFRHAVHFSDSFDDLLQFMNDYQAPQHRVYHH